jgi:hypothetical protein
MTETEYPQAEMPGGLLRQEGGKFDAETLTIDDFQTLKGGEIVLAGVLRVARRKGEETELIAYMMKSSEPLPDRPFKLVLEKENKVLTLPRVVPNDLDPAWPWKTEKGDVVGLDGVLLEDTHMAMWMDVR